MIHAVLGAGGVGAFLGAALARAGREVLLLMREESLAAYDGVVHVESALLGAFDVEVPAAARLERPVDVLWVTPKATQLADAVERAPAGDMTVVPLLNGLDHVELLRRHFGLDAVLPASIAIESERVGPGVVRQLSGFAGVRLSPGPVSESLCSELEDAGHIRLQPPLGYVAFTALLCRARAVMTDSGGVQKEAYLAGVPCVTLRSTTEWVETVEVGWNVLVDLDSDAALAALERTPPAERPELYGDGQAGARVVSALG